MSVTSYQARRMARPGGSALSTSVSCTSSRRGALVSANQRRDGLVPAEPVISSLPDHDSTSPFLENYQFAKGIARSLLRTAMALGDEEVR